MFTYTIIQWLFFFYFYCFFGWCFESSYVSLKSKRWVNRGFMHGPFLPIYGSGAIMMYVVSKPFLEHWWAVYIAGVIGATILEYVTGVAMEALFKVRYWDYSNQPFNFQGHICLGSSLAWGGLTLLMAYVLHQPVEGVVLSLPENVLTVVTLILTLYIAGDFTLSFREALDLRDILVQMERAREELARLQKRIDVIVAVRSEEWNEKKEAFAESVEQRKEAFAESMEQRKEAFAESVEQRKEAFAESVEQRKEAFAERVGHDKDVLAEALRVDELKAELERRVNGIRESMANKLRNNPTMSSTRYKEILKELKEKAEQRKK